MLLRPRVLRPGDTVGLIAPAGPFERARFDAGVKWFENHGYSVVFRDDIFERQDYLAGSDERRADELMQMVRDPAVRAICPVRGGYGILRLLERLDWNQIAANPKIWLGFSDISGLHAAIQRQTRLVTFHSPQLVSLPDAPPEVGRALQKMIGEPSAPGRLFPEALTPLRPGVVEGPLCATNLTLLAHLVGTPHFPDLDGAILALEDVNEATYRIDRLLTHLDLAGVFERVAGLVAGDFTANGDDSGTHRRLVHKRLHDIAERHGLPLAGDASFGHIAANYPLPCGVRTRLNAGHGELTALEAAVIP